MTVKTEEWTIFFFSLRSSMLNAIIWARWNSLWRCVCVCTFLPNDMGFFACILFEFRSQPRCRFFVFVPMCTSFSTSGRNLLIGHVSYGVHQIAIWNHRAYWTQLLIQRRSEINEDDKNQLCQLDQMSGIINLATSSWLNAFPPN